MKLCPHCGSLVHFEPYFGLLECRHCGWESRVSPKPKIDLLLKQLQSLSEADLYKVRQAITDQILPKAAARSAEKLTAR